MKGHFLRAVCTFALVVHSLTLLAQSPPEVSQKVQELEKQLQKFLQEQQPKAAIPLLREIISLDPKDLNAQANLGVLLYFQGSFSEAIPPLRAALALQPDLGRIRALLGLAEKRTGDPVAAQTDLEQALPNLNDKMIQKQAGLELIELDSSFGQYARALPIVEKLQELLPQDPQMLFVSYEIAAQMQQQSVLNMVLVAPNSAELQMIIAGELGRQGEHEKAVVKFREAIRLNPNLPGVHFELGEQLRSSPDPKLNAQAEAEFKAAVAANQYDEKAWCRLGEQAAAKGDFKTAQEDYKKALALQPADSDAQTDLAIALISLNQSDQAIPLLESAIKDDPTNIAAHYRLSVQYRKAGRTADAEREMDEYNHYKELKDKLSQVFQQVRAPSTPM
jgi:tetratricopeptide (TPR) repeat protein